MNTKRCKIIALLIVMALVLSSPAISFAASYDKVADLNLTDTQKKALEENKKARREAMKTLFNDMKEKRAAMREELQRDELNIGKITQINNELKILSAQMLDHRLEGILEVRKILTPEQFRKFMAKTEGRQERFKEKRD